MIALTLAKGPDSNTIGVGLVTSGLYGKESSSKIEWCLKQGQEQKGEDLKIVTLIEK